MPLRELKISSLRVMDKIYQTRRNISTIEIPMFLDTRDIRVLLLDQIVNDAKSLEIKSLPEKSSSKILLFRNDKEY